MYIQPALGRKSFSTIVYCCVRPILMNAISSVDQYDYFKLRLYIIKMQALYAYTELLLSSLVHRYARFGGTCCHHFHGISEDIDNRFSLKVATCVPARIHSVAFQTTEGTLHLRKLKSNTHTYRTSPVLNST